jgi:hypothetical protein
MPGHDTLYEPLTIERLWSIAPMANQWGIYGLVFGVSFGPFAALATLRFPLCKFVFFAGGCSLGLGLLSFFMIAFPFLPPIAAGLGFWLGILMYVRGRRPNITAS